MILANETHEHKICQQNHHLSHGCHVIKFKRVSHDQLDKQRKEK